MFGLCAECVIPVWKRSLESNERRLMYVSKYIFGQDEIRKDILHMVVKYQLGKARYMHKGGKSRSDVSGSNRKPFGQKGSGRARQGTLRKAPHQRGGGVGFPASGNKRYTWEIKVNKKVRKLGLVHGLSDKMKGNRLFIVEGVMECLGENKERWKTRDAKEIFGREWVEEDIKERVEDGEMQRIYEKHMNKLKQQVNKVLYVSGRHKVDEKLRQITRNLRDVNVLPVIGLNVYDILRHDVVLIDSKYVGDIHMRIFGLLESS